MAMPVPLKPQMKGRRGRSRLRVRMHARVVTLYGTNTTVLLDLSLTGARIQGCAGLLAGQAVVLSWDQQEAFGTIIWCNAGMCGIVFDEPISPGSLVAMRDLDQLPSDQELSRDVARAWVQGARRV